MDTLVSQNSLQRSVDPAEVAFYDHFAGTWWDPEGPFWPIHGLNHFRTEYIRQRVMEHFPTPVPDQPLRGLSVLDIGCGGGLLSEAMAAMGAEVHGIDVSRRNIRVAQTHAQLSGANIHYEVVEAEELAQRGAAYDVVLNMEVVEHVTDLEGFLDASARLVGPGGVQFVATINRTFKAWLVAIVGAERVLGWLPRGTHQYERLRRPEEVVRPLRRAGLTPAHRTGVAMNPLTRRFRYTPSEAVNYMLMAAR